WFSLGGRFEYISQDGNRFGPVATTNLLYGPGSSAFSYTVTPTFTFDRYFLRLEYSHVDLQDITRGDLLAGSIGTGFGRTGNRTTQDRYMVETGITF
ncbi:MAG: outer membrane beta-barrel protein, partial [Methylobacterium sp.]